MKIRVLKFVCCLGFIAILLLGGNYASKALASDSDKLCSVGIGKSLTCANSLSKIDDFVNFKNTLSDYVNATDAYHINYITTTWKPSVTRGDPIYKSYYVTDNYNNRLLFTDNDHYGYHLWDYSIVTTGINKTAGYYPASYKSPVSVLEIQNMPSISCTGATAAFCRTYTQANQISVSSASLLPQNNNEDSLVKSTTVSESVYGTKALGNNSLGMKLPSFLPFQIKDVYSQKSKIGKIDATEVTYLSEENSDYITLKASNASVIPTSNNFSIQKGELVKNNLETNYLNNGVTQILDWEQDGLSYTLFASGSKIYTEDQLKNIASSLK